MSEKMYPIPFRSLMNWILAEREKTGEIFPAILASPFIFIKISLLESQKC